MTAPTATPPRSVDEQHHLLVEVSCVRRGRVFRRDRRYPVQNQPCDVVLLVTNNGTRVFPGAVLTDVRISKGTHVGLLHQFMTEFATGTLNPGQSARFSVGPLTSPLEDAVWIAASVRPATSAYSIKTYQRDAATREIMSYDGSLNAWGNSWFIQRQSEVQQARTNLLLLIIAVLTFVDAVFGLKWLMAELVKVVGSVFVWLGRLLGAG